MNRGAGRVVLALSALGYPMTEQLVQRYGRRGVLGVEAVCLGLLTRDLVLIARGTPGLLRTVPASLLYLEALAAAIAAATTAGRLRADTRPDGEAPAAAARRRGAVALLFGLHTVRFWIYLRPGRGLLAAEQARRSLAPSADFRRGAT
jgi:hypothetical protein